MNRAHPELEVTLDWILAIYKVSWPLPVRLPFHCIMVNLNVTLQISTKPDMF